MKKLIVLLLVLGMVFSAVACTQGTGSEQGTNNEEGNKTSETAETIEFTFAHFDGGEVAQEIEEMARNFEAENPGVKINVLAKPEEYGTWIQAQFEAGTLPDVGYLDEELTFNWGNEGHLVDISEYYDVYPALGDRIESTYYEWADGKVAGTNTGGETILMFYNRDHFKAVGYDEIAKIKEVDGELVTWTWEEFEDCMTKLNEKFGQEDENYRPAQIAAWWLYWHPMVLSNGGNFFDEAGTTSLFDSPEVVEAYQQVHDFIYVDKLGHDSSTSEALQMGKEQMLIQGKTSAFVSGYWSHPGIANTIKELQEEDENYTFNLGVTALPSMNPDGIAETVMLGAPTVIFNKEGRTQEELDMILKFYAYHNDAQQVDMFKNGLWMPLEDKYYSDQEYMDMWLTEGIHDLENPLVYTKLTQKSVPSYVYTLKNFQEVETMAINTHLSEVFSNFPNYEGDEASVAYQLKMAKQEADKYLQGTWVVK